CSPHRTACIRGTCWGHPVEHHPTSFVTRARSGGQRHGDSGGPVFVPIDGQEKIVGIGWQTVANDGSCGQGVRDTALAPFASWVHEVFTDGASGGKVGDGTAPTGDVQGTGEAADPRIPDN